MKRLLILIFLLSKSAFAEFDQTQLNFGLGMANISFAETESGLTPSSSTSKTKSPASGSVSVIGGFIEREKFLGPKLSFTTKAFVPLMVSSMGSFIYGGAGINYYFKPVGSTGSFSSKEAKILIIPKWRYHVGASMGAGFLIYNTLESKKSDTLVELSGNAGITYTKNKDWGYRGEFIFGRGIGFNSSTMGMRALLSLCYTME